MDLSPLPLDISNATALDGEITAISFMFKGSGRFAFFSSKAF